MAAAAFDRGRAATFLEKADVPLPDPRLAGLGQASDEALGLDRRLLDECAAAFGVSSSRMSRAAVQGTFHRLYEIEPGPGIEPGRAAASILRIAALPGDRWADLMELECRLAGVLRRAGLPVPDCQYRQVAAGGDVRGVQQVARIAGTSVADLDGDEARMSAALASMGGFLRELHRTGGEGAGLLSLAALSADPPRLRGVHGSWDDYLQLRLDEHVQDCRQAGDLSPDEGERVRARFEGARHRFDVHATSLLHGDPGGHNFIVEAGSIRAVLDWEDALVGDPLFDLASLCTFQPERRHAAIVGGYGAELVPGTPGWERFWLYFLRIALAKTVHRRRFGYTDRPGRPPAARRIQLALARLEGNPA